MPDTPTPRFAPSGQDLAAKALINLPALMRTVAAGKGSDLAGLIGRVAANPDPAAMLMDMSLVCQILGDRDIALAMQTKALALQQRYRLPTASREVAIRLLAITTPGAIGDNTPLEFLLEDSDVALELLYLGPDLPLPPALSTAPPEHDLLFIAVCESDQNRPLLKQIERLTETWPRPVLNAADKIAGLSRDGASARLKSSAELIMPTTARIDRQRLAQIGSGQRALGTVLDDGDFPAIVRPLGSHAGRGLARLEGPSAIDAYLGTVSEHDFYLARFVDYRDPDGQYRKYRIVLIEGRPFACHMAISSNWMIHYLHAGMAESAAKRAEEEAFMCGFDAGFARRHEAALKCIAERFELDYLVIDCAESRDGRLLVFELDNTGFVHAMDPEDVFPYKQVQMRKVFAAFRTMLAGALERRTKQHLFTK
ncbi:hypothetical protein GALL_238510 [mine drainage metagenome]|uniref:ATP-grasp domain-containing protein n=1 Tax=mine drainage metagenome TaxID=410659 RepID=A0A1J5RDP9_9ZZZZ